MFDAFYEFHPHMPDSKAMPLAILMTNAFGRPATDGIDYVYLVLDNSIAFLYRLSGLTCQQLLKAVGQLVVSGVI